MLVELESTAPGEPTNAPPPHLQPDDRRGRTGAVLIFLLGIALGLTVSSGVDKQCGEPAVSAAAPEASSSRAADAAAGVSCRPSPPPPPCPLLPQAPSNMPTPVPPPVGTEMAVAKITFPTDATGPQVTRATIASTLDLPSVGPLSSKRAVIVGAEERNGVNYFVWDDDRNTQNDLQTSLSGIDELRECCAEFGLSAVRITDAEQVDGVLRPLLQDSGYDLSRGSGVALGMDYSADNSYSSLENAGVPVSSIMTDLHTSYGYSGDHQTDQTSDKQHLAGFGWARSETDVGIEDWGFHHPMQAVLCSDQADALVVPRSSQECSTSTAGSDTTVGFDLTNPPGRCGPTADSAVGIRTLYRICALLCVDAPRGGDVVYMRCACACVYRGQQ